MPELRIVEDDLWSRVKDKQKAVRVARKLLQDGNALGARKRPPYLFSGLIKSTPSRRYQLAFLR